MRPNHPGIPGRIDLPESRVVPSVRHRGVPPGVNTAAGAAFEQRHHRPTNVATIAVPAITLRRSTTPKGTLTFFTVVGPDESQPPPQIM